MALHHQQSLFGLMAEFDEAEQLMAAATQAREAGYRDMDAYTPFPVHGLDEIIVDRRTRLPLAVLVLGLLGAITGFGLQTYLNTIDYPLNVGGRPAFSWPAWIPITFELTILFAAFGAFLGVFVANNLPQLYHPVFNTETFERASQDRFFLCIEHTDQQFDESETRKFLQNIDPAPLRVSEVMP